MRKKLCGIKYEKFYPGKELNVTDDLHEKFGFRTDYQIIPYTDMKKIIKIQKEKHILKVQCTVKAPKPH